MQVRKNGELFTCILKLMCCSGKRCKKHGTECDTMCICA